MFFIKIILHTLNSFGNLELKQSKWISFSFRTSQSFYYANVHMIFLQEVSTLNYNYLNIGPFFFCKTETE